MNVFQIKTKPHFHERIQQFLSENFICIGWPNIGNLEKSDKEDIRNRLKQEYGISAHKLGNALGQVNTFINTMKKDDIIFISEKEWAYIGVIGEYEYVQKYDNNIDGMCHRRSVEWINKVLINDLPNGIQKLLSSRNTICKYPEIIDPSEIHKYIKKHPIITEKSSIKLKELFHNALEVLEEELKSENPERRLKAATELVRLNII